MFLKALFLCVGLMSSCMYSSDDQKDAVTESPTSVAHGVDTSAFKGKRLCSMSDLSKKFGEPGFRLSSKKEGSKITNIFDDWKHRPAVKDNYQLSYALFKLGYAQDNYFDTKFCDEKAVKNAQQQYQDLERDFERAFASKQFRSRKDLEAQVIEKHVIGELKAARARVYLQDHPCWCETCSRRELVVSVQPEENILLKRRKFYSDLSELEQKANFGQEVNSEEMSRSCNDLQKYYQKNRETILGSNNLSTQFNGLVPGLHRCVTAVISSTRRALAAISLFSDVTTVTTNNSFSVSGSKKRKIRHDD